ncbi:MAG: 2-hydroxyacid dehydrogenase [bacterium]|nr:2-hydroxyacid dehydrogenase [bacterium]
MKTAVFSTKSYDSEFLGRANDQHQHDLTYHEARLTATTAELAKGSQAVCAFVNDELNADVLRVLSNCGVRVVALRCAGYNNVDLQVADELGLAIVRVPAYSPYAVAEHTAGLILALNRHIPRAHNRVRDGNFSLAGLLGFDLHGRTVGVVGTGKVGVSFAKIMAGFGCRVLAYDVYPNDACREAGATYVDLSTLFAESDIISFHCPLTPETYHLVNEETLAEMKDGVMIINTSRGGIIDTRAAIQNLKRGKIGYLGLDVYEEEADFFFEDLSDRVIADDDLSRLLTFPNVIVTGHQAFFTRDALQRIAETTLQNLSDIDQGRICENAVHAP